MKSKRQKTRQPSRRPSSTSAAYVSAIDQISAPIPYARNEVIFSQGEPADYLYKIESGCVRAFYPLDKGSRQVLAFYLAGDIFGLGAHDRHTISSEATTPSLIRVIRRKVLMGYGGDVAMSRHLLQLTAAELRRARDHNLRLLKGAQDRVIGFLREMVQRGQTQDEIELLMSRRDIADYLGLTIETVSRTFSRLEAAAAISLPSPWRIVLRDPSALN
ncbi:MAG: helix-turn-helix domain-containing protein [Rhizobiales bacterium]|nr:helix-turn-helix domain-containing protein [Hyphomicrobiales bacterium]